MEHLPDDIEIHSRIEKDRPSQGLEDIAKAFRNLDFLVDIVQSLFGVVLEGLLSPGKEPCQRSMPELANPLYLVNDEVEIVLHNDLLVVHELIDQPPQHRGNALEIFVDVVAHDERRENVIIDQGRPQVRQIAGGMAPTILVEKPGDRVVEHGVPQQLQSLVAIGERVYVIARVCHGLGGFRGVVRSDGLSRRNTPAADTPSR